MSDKGELLGVFIDLQGRLHEQMPQRPVLDKRVDALASHHGLDHHKGNGNLN